MVYWRIAEYLERMPEPWTRYRLVQESGLAPPVVYRVSARNAPVRRIDGRTLDGLCTALGATPGDLLEHVPGTGKRGTRRSTQRRKA